MRKLWIAFGVLALCTILLLLWGFWIEPRRLVLRETTLRVPNWPAKNEDLRIAVITDLHVGSPHHGLPTLARIISRVNEARPDVILILGDLVIQGVMGGDFVAPERIAEELRSLRARAGTYAVLGNHDWWLNAPRVIRALSRAGIAVLEDSAQQVQLGRSEFWLAGVSDFWEGRHDVRAALRHVPPGAPAILFTHNPDIFPDVPTGPALTIAGHTHGGQVDVPIIGPPVVPSKFGRRYARGHVVENGRHLLVSSGTGTSILPVRIRVPPEIVILTLRPQK